MIYNVREVVHGVYANTCRKARGLKTRAAALFHPVRQAHGNARIGDEEQRRIASRRLIAKIPTIAAMAYKYSIGQPFVYPRNDLDYASNFLHMCFSVPCKISG